MTSIDLPAWRILPEGAEAAAGAPVLGPQGRFHHEGQRALYAGLSPEASCHSITRYLGDADGPKILVALRVTGGPICDLTDGGMAARYGFPVHAARHRWDEDVAKGRWPVTWDLSDRVRADGYRAMIYPTRLRPDLSNIVLFDWTDGGGLSVSVGAVQRLDPAMLEAAKRRAAELSAGAG